MALLTSFVVSSHTLITALYLSSSVIKPLAYCLRIFSTFSSDSASNPFLAAGTCTSSIEKVIPANVEYLNPNALI